jgi:MFS family permease
VTLLRDGKLTLALGGALCGYLVLFGPLVLVPQILAVPGRSEAHIGLLLSSLPVGFGVAALGAEAVLPRSLDDRARGAVGAVVCTASLVALVMVPLSFPLLALLLALTGLGLGVFIPANNTTIMRSAPAASSATLGGLVNMARGLGTTLGVALVTLALHVAPGGPASTEGRTPGSRLAFGVLAFVGALAVLSALAGRRGSAHDGGERPEEGAAGAFG